MELEGLWIYNNNFKYISPTIFNHLTNLNHVAVKGERHTCLNKDYVGIDKIQYLKEDVSKCANTNEVTLTSGEIFGVLDQCNINTAVFVKIVKSIHTNYKVSTTLSVTSSPIEQENNCQKFSTFFSLFKI